MFAIQVYEDGELALEKAERAHLEIRRLLAQLRTLEIDLCAWEPNMAQSTRDDPQRLRPSD